MEKVIEHYQIFYADTKHSNNRKYEKDLCCKIFTKWINKVGVIYQDEPSDSEKIFNVDNLPIIGFFNNMMMDENCNLFVDLHLFKESKFRFFTTSGFGTCTKGIVDSDYEFDCLMNSETSTIPHQTEQTIKSLEREIKELKRNNIFLERQNQSKDSVIKRLRNSEKSEVTVEPEDESEFIYLKDEPEEF